MKTGWIYVLASESVPLHKIGLTTTSPAQRIREINGSGNYGPFGPWTEIDVRKVRDVTAVETSLHRHLASKRSNLVPNSREAFEISREDAREVLNSIPDTDLTEAVPIHKLTVEADFMDYLMLLFESTGLEHFRDIQESWTFTLFPSTNGGRFFTLNIDRHEVAFSQPFSDDDTFTYHSIVVDDLIRRDRNFTRLLKTLGGKIRHAPYSSNWGNAAQVTFEATFEEASLLFQNTTFRRALIAYWYDALLRMKSRGTRSLFSRFHNYDAVSEIFRHMEQRRAFRAPVKD